MQAANAEMEEFKKVEKKKYSDQGAFFLNAFWVECGNEAEKVWQWCQKFHEFDSVNGKEGNDLDEFWSHKFLETVGETMTVIQMRDVLKEIDVDNNRRISLLEYCLYRFKQTVKELLKRPQGMNEELAKAQQALAVVQTEIEKIEKKKRELEAASHGGGVKAMQAKNELQQLLVADNTELNKALITAEAAVRKAQKLGGLAAQGVLFWIDRDLQEAKKYKPKSKQ